MDRENLPPFKLTLAKIRRTVRLTDSDMNSTAGEDPESAVSDRILGAALKELTLKGIGSFSIEGVARRADVGVRAIRDRWPNANALYVASVTWWGRRVMPVPDSGSLRGDWTEFSRSFMAAVNSEIGRRILAAAIVSPSDWDVTDIRETFKQARAVELGVMVRRAVARGECRAGTDAELVTEVLTAGLSMPLIFSGEPVSDEHSALIVDLLLEGVYRR